MDLPASSNSNSFREDLQYFSSEYFQAAELNLDDASIKQKIANIVRNLGELTKEDLQYIDDSIKLRIFQKAILGKDDFSPKIQALVTDRLFSQLLEKNPEDPHMLSFCLSFEPAEGIKQTLRLEHNTYLSQAQIEGLFASRSEAEIDQITTLDLSGSERLENLNFLRFFPNLQTLRLDGCSNLETLNGIESLSSTLQHLSLANCYQLQHLDQIKTCGSLISLNANSCTRLESIGKIRVGETKEGSGLAYFQNLEVLELSHCNLLLDFSFETIKTLTGLKILKLTHLPLITDISWLANFSNLQELDLSHTGITDATYLNHLSPAAQQKVNLEGCSRLQAQKYPAWYKKL